jgi:hypothetical protein
VNSASKDSRLLLVAAVLVISMAFILFFTPMSQFAFAGVPEHSEQCARKGGAKVSKGLAKKLVAYAIKKYDIGDLVDEQATKKARKEVYGFLKWKLGNPLAICGQYIIAGQTDFNKKNSDEAAAALLGFDLSKEKAGHSQFYFPPNLLSCNLRSRRLLQFPSRHRSFRHTPGYPRHSMRSYSNSM